MTTWRSRVGVQTPQLGSTPRDLRAGTSVVPAVAVAATGPEWDAFVDGAVKGEFDR
jgi:hypothetical protein